MKKLYKLILFFVLCTIIYKIYGLIPKNYTFNYLLNGFNVHEQYDKSKESYVFSINKNKVTYEYSLKSKYINKRGILKKVKLKDNCIWVSLINKEDFSLCKNETGYYTTYAYNEINGGPKDSYKNIAIYELMNRKFFVWNYNGFIALAEDDYKMIELFKSDIYEPVIVSKIKDYILIADYDKKYHFNTMYLINYKNNKVETVNLDRDIYFNSYVLGVYKNNVYLYDKQKEREYKINPFKQTISKNSYETLVDNKWEKVSKNKLNKGNVTFYNVEDYYYFLENNKLYYKTLNSTILISDLEVSNIVDQNESEIYFVSENALYFSSIDNGTKKLLEYSEWNFNNKNIYIF